MRKTKRFTPQTLERFKKNRRGCGIYSSYMAWHQVTRGDPSSRGLSHIQRLNERQVDLLSNGELVCLYFASMLPDLIDVREQFPLSLHISRHELYQYDSNVCEDFPGTVDLAKELGVKHPMTHGGGESTNWIISTDLLLTLDESGSKKMLAISVKALEKLTNRKHELLSIERAYWQKRHVEWILITPSEFDQRVALRLRDTAPWGLGIKSSYDELKMASEVSFEMQGQPLQNVLSKLTLRLYSHEVAQRAFWQGVWSGKILLDLRRGWRPHEPIQLLTVEEFSELNPILAMRTRWI